MVAKTHTDDPFWKFRDQPQEKVAISACCWPRNPSDIAERLYRRRRTATLLFIPLKEKKPRYREAYFLNGAGTGIRTLAWTVHSRLC